MPNNQEKKLNIFRQFRSGAVDFFAYANFVLAGLILSVVYIVAVLPTTFVAKALGRNFLSTKPDKSAISYWQDFPAAEEIKKHIYRRF